MNKKKLKNYTRLIVVAHNTRCFFFKLCVYYRKFINNFVLITKSLYEFIQNVENKKFKLITMNFFVQNVFEIIKNVIYNDRILIQSNIFRFFIIEMFSISIEKSYYIKLIKITKNVLLHLRVKRFFYRT